VSARFTIADIVPGGILPTDVWHVRTHDGSCSRCRSPIPEDEVPLLLWDEADTNRMLAYCHACTGRGHHDSELEDDDMSRSGYTDEYDSINLWRQAVDRAVAGKRGQAFLRELVAALDALPEPKLIAGGLLDRSGNVCALGAVAKARGLDVPVMEDTEDAEHTAPEMGKMFGIARSMAGEIMCENEDLVSGETPEARWVRIRAWAVRMLREPKP